MSKLAYHTILTYCMRQGPAATSQALEHVMAGPEPQLGLAVGQY